MKKSVILFSAMIVLTVMAAMSPAKCADNLDEKSTIHELLVLDYMESLDIPDHNLNVEDRVEIYDQDNNLVAFGQPGDTKIKRLITMSDLLTETQRTQLYRLSYE